MPWLPLALALIALGVAGRLLPHPDNFTPAASVGLFAGFVFPSAGLAALTMLAVMVLSDLVVGFYDTPVMLAVYGALLFPLIFRSLLRRRFTPLRVLFAAVSCSAVFFLVTNLACWWVWYPRTTLGLLECYTNALPFLRHTLLGDLTWSTTLFLTYAVVIRTVDARHGITATSPVK